MQIAMAHLEDTLEVLGSGVALHRVVVHSSACLPEEVHGPQLAIRVCTHVVFSSADVAEAQNLEEQQ